MLLWELLQVLLWVLLRELPLVRVVRELRSCVVQQQRVWGVKQEKDEMLVQVKHGVQEVQERHEKQGKDETRHS